MKIFTPHISLKISNGTLFEAQTRYVIPESLTDLLIDALVEKHGLLSYRASGFDSYCRYFAGQDLGEKSLLIYRHGAFGDTLICTALVDYIVEKNPRAKISIYTSEQAAPLYDGLGVVVKTGYPTFEEAMEFDYHLLLENMLEMDEEPDQRNCYDSMFSRAGYFSVPEENKRPVLRLDVSLLGDGFRTGCVVIQRESSNNMRTWPYVDELTRMLVDAGCDVVVAEKDGLVAKSGVLAGWKIHTPSFVDLIPTIRDASLVIASDSSLSHLAAALGTKCLTLWGPFSPDDRQKYYPLHYAIDGLGCPFYPCRTHFSNPPEPRCKQAKGWSEGTTHCAALGSIPAEMVAAAAINILNQ